MGRHSERAAQRSLAASARKRALEAAARYEAAVQAADGHEHENAPLQEVSKPRDKPRDVSSALTSLLKNVPDAPTLLYDGSMLPRDMLKLQQTLLQRVAEAKARIQALDYLPESATTIQAGWRGHCARSWARMLAAERVRQHAAAACLQQRWRTRDAEVVRPRAAAVRVQAAWRGVAPRRALAEHRRAREYEAALPVAATCLACLLYTSPSPRDS